MSEKKKKLKIITDAIKMSIVIFFLVLVIFMTVVSINYSISHNIVKMNILTSDNIKRTAVSIPSQDSEEALIRQEEEINPIEYLKTTNTSAIPVSSLEEVVINTKKIFLLETKKSDKDLYIRVYKNGDKKNIVPFEPKIDINTRNYEIKFNAPKDPGVYTYYMVLRFNRYNAEYMFNLEVI